MDPYKKSDMLNVLNVPLVKEKLDSMKTRCFRNEHDIQRFIFHTFGVAKYGYKLVKTNVSNLIKQFLTFRFRDLPAYTADINDMYYGGNPLSVRDATIRIRKKMTCINDDGDENVRKSNHDFLTKFFSNKSKFEK
jgi:hypothetical protein